MSPRRTANLRITVSTSTWQQGQGVAFCTCVAFYIKAAASSGMCASSSPSPHPPGNMGGFMQWGAALSVRCCIVEHTWHPMAPKQLAVTLDATGPHMMMRCAPHVLAQPACRGMNASRNQLQPPPAPYLCDDVGQDEGRPKALADALLLGVCSSGTSTGPTRLNIGCARYLTTGRRALSQQAASQLQVTKYPHSISRQPHPAGRRRGCP